MKTECDYKGYQPYWNWGKYNDLPKSPIFNGDEWSMGGNGDYVAHKELQYVIPSNVVNELMAMVLQIKSLFDANALMIGIATVLLLGLVILLSLKLRQREMETMFKLGCSRSTMASLQVAELAIIGSIGLLIVAGLIYLTWNYADDLIRALFLRG